MPVVALLLAVTLHACGGAIGSGELLGAPAAPRSRYSSEPPLQVPGSLSPSGPVPSIGATPAATIDIEGMSLESLLPNELRGVRLFKFSISGDEFEADASTMALLERLGASPDDASAAFAVDPAGRVSGQVVALRVAGADSELLRDEYRAAVEGVAGSELREEEIGGRVVLTGENPEDPASSVYFYARGDVLLFVFTSDPSLAAEALALLP